MGRRGAMVCIAGVLVAVTCTASEPAARADMLQAGVGRADITPPTGYFMMGWVRGDAVARGQHTRLFARAIVLQQGAQKVALVAEDLNGIPGGVLAAAADRLKAYGFSQQNVLDSASHTHAAPSQFYNFSSYDTVFMTLSTPTQQNVTGTIDPQLYEFEVRQLAAAILKADNDLGPARIGWGAGDLPDLTQNRSLEAHLANFGINEPYGTGSPGQDPGGPVDTIDPAVDVLRVDKLLSTPAHQPRSGARHKRATHRRAKHRHAKHRRAKHRHAKHRAKHLRAKHRHAKHRAKHRHAKHRAKHGHAKHRRARHRPPMRPTSPARSNWVPVAMWSTFANHGTVNKSTFTYYNADHHGAAIRVTEDALRRAGNVPASQDVVNAYGNSDEGDVTAGIMHTGPADAEWVGRREADVMLAAWRDAGQRMTGSPSFDQRWTRICFCAQTTAGGPVDSNAVFGLPQLTGSEEGRGPLYDITHVSFEDVRAPINDPVQGFKVQEARPPVLSVPRAVALMAVRLGDRMIVSVPGEMTVTMGQRLRSAVMQATSGSGVAHVVISGLANEYLSYFTTPEEYQRQHYEGGSTLYGHYSSNLLAGSLADLSHRLVMGQGAPEPYPYDPTNGVAPGSPPFGDGAPTATASAQPAATPRLGHADFAWAGGPRGLDRPVGSAFVAVRRREGSAWTTVADDLGLQILWSVDSHGAYRATWEVPLDATPGTYDFVITANRYRLESAPFTVGPAATLTLMRSGSSGATLSLHYPAAVAEQDITYRPATVGRGTLTARVGAGEVTVAARDGAFAVPAPAGARVTVMVGGARDSLGNTNANELSFTA